MFLICLVGFLMSNVIKRVKVSSKKAGNYPQKESEYVGVDPGIWILSRWVVKMSATALILLLFLCVKELKADSR